MSKNEVFHSTVGQLVDFLRTLPQDLPVLTSSYENGFEIFYQPSVIKVRHEPENMYYEGEFQISDEEDQDIFKAVVLRRVVRG